MFVRFRSSAQRLALSIVETRRTGGAVKHEHIASLGSVRAPPSVADRIEFWKRVHECLVRLSNRIDAEEQAKILAAVHARIPMTTIDEQRSLQLDNAKADAGFWERMHDMHAATAQDHKGLAATAAKAIAQAEAKAAKADANVKASRERVERIEKGEDVQGGLGKPMDYETFVRILLDAGWTRREIRDAQRLAQLSEEVFRDVLLPEVTKRRELAEKAAKRIIFKRFGV